MTNTTIQHSDQPQNREGSALTHPAAHQKTGYEHQGMFGLPISIYIQRWLPCRVLQGSRGASLA